MIDQETTDRAAPPAAPTAAPSEPSAVARVRGWLLEHGWRREIALLVAVYGLYSLIRNAVPDQVAQAQANAREVLAAERALGLDIERSINVAAASIEWLIIPANYYYATLHMTVTAAVLIWLYRRRALHYARARGLLLAMTLMALVCYWLYPLAPPRLMTGGGYVDTVHEYGLWGVSPSEEMASLSNQYAAMPSMHFGWSLWAGVAVAVLARRRLLRALGIVYPLVTLAVIVVTANHFIIDAVAAGVLYLASPVAVAAWDRTMGRVLPGATVRDDIGDVVVDPEVA